MLNRESFARLLDMPRAAQLVSAAAALALTFVFIMQYGFGLHPCILCLWQRVPFAAVIVLAVAAMQLRPYGMKTRILLLACGAAFLTGACLALFHTGVELHWWLGTKDCTMPSLHGNSVDDLREQLLHTVVTRCDQISWKFLGLSMANWNLPFSLGLSVFSAQAARNVKP